MPDEYVLAGDVGGTNLRIAAVSTDGKLLCQVSDSTPRDGTTADVVEAISDACEACISEVGSGVKPAAFGLALAALVNPRQGLILSSPNIPILNNLPLAKALSERLNLDVVLENDATAAAIGEHWLGSSRKAESSIFVTLGTGIGGGLILDGRTYRGIDGTAGEVGHIVVEPDGEPCGCGSRGCVEQYGSATAIVRIARELAQRNSDSPLGRVNDLEAKDVYDSAVGGDAVALETFRIMGRYLGIALSSLVDVLNPELIVIGGGAAAGWDLFIEHVRSEIRSRAFRHPADRVQIVKASLGEGAGVFGAARVALDSLAAESSRTAM